MANDIYVNVKIDGLSQSATGVKQLSDAISGLANPAKKMQASLKESENSLGSLIKNGFSKLGVVAAGALAATAAAFAGREIIKAAVEKQNAVTALNNTLASLGIYSKETSDELLNFADNLEKTTKFSDDQVISTLNLLGAMTTLDKSGLQKASKAALDLSSTLGIELESASQLVAKSIAGNTGALGRYGIQVQKGSSETENLTNTLDALSRMAGRSEKDINTFSGAMTFLKNGFSELLTSLGNIIVTDPLIAKFIKNTAQGFFSLADIIGKTKTPITDLSIAFLTFLNQFESKIKGVKNSVLEFIDNGIIQLFNYARELRGLPPIEFKIVRGEKSKKFFDDTIASLKESKKQFAEVQSNIENAKPPAKNPLMDTEKVKSAFQDLYKSIAGLDQGELGRLQAVNDQKVKVVKDYLKVNKDVNGEASKALLILEADFQKQKTDLQKKQLEESNKLRQDEINRIKANPLANLLGLDKDLTKEIKFVISPKVQGLVEGFGEALKKGAAGATDLLTGALTSGVDVLLPGVGTALKPFIDMFAQGPEATQKMLEEFARQIPKFVTNIISSVPVFIKTLIREIPKVIQELVGQLPKVIEAFAMEIPVIIEELVKSLPVLINAFVLAIPTIATALANQSPFIAGEIALSLIKEMPNIVASLINGLWNGLVEMFNSLIDQFTNIFDFGGGGGGLWPFAEGGKIVKGGIAGKDSVPAALMPGEVVVDRGLTQQMQEYFDSKQSRQSDLSEALLAKIVQLLSAPQTVNTSVQLNNRTLAEIMINLNRTNARLTV